MKPNIFHYREHINLHIYIYIIKEQTKQEQKISNLVITIHELLLAKADKLSSG